MTPDRLETLRGYKVEDIQVFLKTQKSEVISVDMQDYIVKMDRCSVIINTQGANMTLATEELRRCFPDLSYTQARRIYYDALEYFHVDEPVSAAAWDAVYADQYDKLQALAIASGKLAVARKCIEKSHELRTTRRQEQDFRWQPPTFVINIAVKPEDLGYKSRKIMDIARRREDAELRQMIGSLETTPAEKQRLLADAEISVETTAETQEDYEPEDQ
jgi:hypothetical protein